MPSATIQRKAALRLFVAGVLVSLATGAAVLSWETERIDDFVVDVAEKEALAFLRAHKEELSSDRPRRGRAMKWAVQTLIQTHFVVVEIYDLQRNRLVEVVHPEAEAVERALSSTQHAFPSSPRSEYRKMFVEGTLYLQVLVPFVDDDKTLLGYFEGVYRVDEETEEKILQVVVGSLVAVVIIVFATALAVYPVIISLNKGLVQHAGELLRAKRRAEAADRAKTTFLANMSHELRTPLNAIIGFADVLKAELLGPLGNAKYREYAEDIGKSGTHLLEVIAAILDYARLEAGKQEARSEAVEIPRAIRAGLADVRRSAREKGLTVEEDIARALPRLKGDGRLIKHMLANLLANAVERSPAGGRIVVAARADPDGALTVAVSDSGTGMSEADTATVLSPFGEADSGLGHNTSLGMPLAKAFADRQGAHMVIERAAGVGTTVTVRFPPERVVS